MNDKYIAITIGPIYKVTAMAKSTKAQWASSYFFSYLAKCIISPFKTREFVLPIVDDSRLWYVINEDNIVEKDRLKAGERGMIGRFPDRFIFKSKLDDLTLLKDKIIESLERIGREIGAFLKDNGYHKVDETEVVAYLRNYMKVFFFEKGAETDNIVDECNSILDVLELQGSYCLEEPYNYFEQFFENEKLYKSFLVKEALGQSDIRKQLFESLDRISGKELIEDKEHKLKKMAYHNYIAIISADGDNMSKTIAGLLQNNQSVQLLSKKLLEFGESLFDEICESFGAKIIFIGGDDLLIYAPVIYKGKNIFDLIKKISEVFDGVMNDFMPKPTLSLGVSVTYEKFPMGEALHLSNELLGKAKNKERHPEKNTVALSVQRHSGQTFGIEIEKDSPLFELVLNLISEFVSDDANLISSIIYWLENNFRILSIILSGNESDKEKTTRLDNYFTNSFDEPVHENLQPFFCSLYEFMIEAQKLFSDKGITVEDASDKDKFSHPVFQLSSVLRFIHFVKIEKDEI